jgi:hypothetical protein
MQIEIPDTTQQQSIAAGFADVEQYIFSLVERDRERLAIQTGLDSLATGQVNSFEEFDREFRLRHNLETR